VYFELLKSGEYLFMQANLVHKFWMIHVVVSMIYLTTTC